METVESLVMVKQISAVFSSGFSQIGFFVGTCLGLNDIVASTIMTGCDLEMDRAGKNEDHHVFIASNQKQKQYVNKDGNNDRQ